MFVWIEAVAGLMVILVCFLIARRLGSKGVNRMDQTFSVILFLIIIGGGVMTFDGIFRMFGKSIF